MAKKVIFAIHICVAETKVEFLWTIVTLPQSKSLHGKNAFLRLNLAKMKRKLSMMSGEGGGGGQCIFPDQVLRGLADYTSALLNFLPMNWTRPKHCCHNTYSYCVILAMMMFSWGRSALLHGIYCIFHWVNFANLRLRAKTTHLTQKL